MKKSEQIAASLKEKREAAEALLAKPDRTADETASLKTLVAEVTTLNAEQKEAEGLEAFDEDNKKALAALKTPRRPQFLGMVPAGETIVEVNQNATKASERYRIESETGFLGLSPQQAEAIKTPEYKAAFRNYLRGHAAMDQQSIKTINEGIDSQGGYLVPDEYLTRLIEKMAAPTSLASYVTKLNTSRDALTIPRVIYNTDDIYTTGIRITWTGEMPTPGTVHRVTDPVFGLMRIPVHTAMMSLPITNDMVEDSAFAILSWATGKFQETIDLLYENMILNGTGVGQPLGILNAPNTTDQPATSPIGAAAAIDPDGIVGITYDIPPQYDGNSRFVLNKQATGKAIALLKDSNDRYLFSAGITNADGIALGRPSTLVGFPFTYSAFMPSPGSGAYPLIFGDLTGYVLVNRIGFSIQVLRERYAEENQIVLLGRIRFGGQVAEPWKLRIGTTT